MRPRVSHIILVAAALAALIILGAHATTPVLYTAENTSTAAHADPETVLKRSPGNAAALIPLMDELLGQTGTLALTIKVKDYESAERDLARYTELSGQFSNLVVKLDVSETDIGEFQQKTRANQESLTALLNDSRRFDELQRLEIEVEDDDGQRMAIAYEGEALRQKMQKTFSAYREREPAVTRIAQNYDVNTTPYRESVEHFAEVADAADDWREKTGGDTPLSPLSIGLTPTEGYYGDEIWIAGTCADALPGTPVEIYVDSRLAGNATLDSEGWYAYPYRVGRLLAGPHLVYATADNLYSGVRTFTALPGNTTLTLALAEVNRTTVACTGTLKTGDRAVTDAPVLLRVDTTTLVGTETDNNGTYAANITLPAGKHTIKAEFHAAGYPLNYSESETRTISTRGELPSLLPIIAALAALLGTGWYLRRRHQGKVPARAPPETVWEEEPLVEEREIPPVEIGDLPPREAATLLFRALRARLGIPETKTPRNCARIAPDHAAFFERYELIRYAGEVPTEEELQWMKKEARGDEHAA
ncbi:hypothetical protein BN140_2128 [Methanoculleus bourgensis MS2]|jgi:hypothetical protein|uniref:DUF4129 domain-containing protein n=1 Tax=Methanoculleus bourgensis (strain ATCC 43281 / DSM 3045 / OCM 15 / MS2) TaxID=1201294 RepID=I7KDN8_METBM|nr:Ig-like domain repeat protein [Methanoculleus bourgensis]CCJ37051.1 hypothetical protein BN140_2128 [Methanoculleus bourgensis MS2]